MRLAIFCPAFILLVSSAYAQKAPAAPVRPSSPTTSPLPATNPNSPSSNTTTPSAAPRPIFLSGKVVLQDGTPPPDSVKIERICAGNPHPQAYTDSKGRFQFQLDSALDVETDASEGSFHSSALGASRQTGSTLSPRNDLMGCDLRAILPGYISSNLSLANHNSFDNPEVGTIVLRRAGGVEGTTISMSSLNAPKDAQKAFEKGRDSLKKEKTDEAERSFQKAVGIYPKFASAWYQLGLLQTRDRLDEAEKSFNRSIESDPKFVSPYLSLALILERSKRWQQGLEISDKVVRLNSADFPQAYFFKAVASFNLGDSLSAEKDARKTIELDMRHEFPQAEKLLGSVLAQKNDLPGGAEHLQKYLDLAPNAPDVEQVKRLLEGIGKQSLQAQHP